MLVARSAARSVVVSRWPFELGLYFILILPLKKAEYLSAKIGKNHKMAHFQLEQELQAALKLDSTINFNTSSALNRSSRLNTKENANGSAKKRAASAGRSNSSLLNGSLNRSRILGIQQPQALGTKRSTSTGRLGQLISKCLLGVIVWTNIPTKYFPGFLPLPLKRAQIKKYKGTLYR